MQSSALTIRSRFKLAFGLIVLSDLLSVGVAVSIWQAGGSARTPSIVLGTAALLSIAMAGWGFSHFIRLVCGGLDRQRKKFDEIATTLDLSRRSASPRRDEFGASAGAFDRLMRRIESTVVSVHLSTEALQVASSQIASGNMDLSARTEAQAASLEETAASMSQLTETVKQNAEHMRGALVMARQASMQVETAASAADRMVATIKRIDQNASKVSDVTNLIEGIAFQTNLLALNAAVEAARAGHQGQSFAVVANEVRGLAQRSTAASREIKELIESSAMTAQQGLAQAVDVGETMGQLTQTIKDVSDAFAGVETASNAQQLSIEQVNIAVESMESATQQNAALVEEVAAAAKSLDDQTLELRREVAAFKMQTDPGNIKIA
jgi:methyl-accepting chemotaxis protein